MDYEKRKRQTKGDLEDLKEDLFSITNYELIEAYKAEILNKSLELEDIKLRIIYLSDN
tara:strand:- start:98 stop:271 length:174 start_codon:yes stop_codon:yes gene_type:complete